MMPFHFCFPNVIEKQYHEFNNFLAFIILIDILLLFNQGYFDQGIYVKERNSIVRNCLRKKKHKLLLDSFIVIGLLTDNSYIQLAFIFKIIDLNKIY
jgi:hypothetical protein